MKQVVVHLRTLNTDIDQNLRVRSYAAQKPHFSGSIGDSIQNVSPQIRNCSFLDQIKKTDFQVASRTIMLFCRSISVIFAGTVLDKSLLEQVKL